MLTTDTVLTKVTSQHKKISFVSDLVQFAHITIVKQCVNDMKNKTTTYILHTNKCTGMTAT